jgi:hypothetical protein
MDLSLKKKLFDEYNFNKIKTDYTVEGIPNNKIEYYNLEKVLKEVLFYKKNDITNDISDKYVIVKDDIQYINLKGILELSKLRNDYRMCLLHIDLKLSQNEIIQDLDQVISNNIKYSEQSKFTYIIYKFLEKEHDKVKLLTEEYLVETGKSYRCDILLPDDNVRIIIEHYESFHKNNKTYDGVRQETLEGLGYYFLKFNEGESIRKFINLLNSAIQDRLLFLDDSKHDQLIISTLVKSGCDITIAKNMYQLFKIGEKYEIKYKQIMMSLGYSKEEYQDAIQDLEFKIPENYYQKKDDDIYLNSEGYKLLLLRTNNPSVYPYQEYYVKMEKICYQTILDSRNQAKKMYNNMKIATPQLINYGKSLADKTLIKNLDKYRLKTNELNDIIHFYELERKKNNKLIIDDDSHQLDIIELKEGDIISPYIPALIYTQDINEEVEINKLKSLYKVFKDRVSFRYVLNIIKKRLKIDNISAYDKILPNCKIIQ